MLFGEIISVALRAIRANFMRSFLAVLGIVIGVAAVITMVALGTGAQRAVQERIQALGTNLLQVYAGQTRSRGVASADRVSMTTDDYKALLAGATTLSAVVPEIRRNQQIKYVNQNANINITGTVPDYIRINNYKMDAGSPFSAGDNESRKRVAVLGSAVPEMLGANGAAMIGQSISIRGILFEIIGLMQEKGATGSWNNPDEIILIPLETAQYRIFGSDRLNSITVEVREAALMNVAMIDMERVLRREHAIKPGADNDFNIRNRGEFLATFEETTRTFTFLLGGIAAISLLVGGIGIMNIMLVSVTERTREIGIRKALGARRRDIMLQFLVEATALCLLGGGFGIVMGWGAAYALSTLANWNTLVSPPAVIIAVVFSAGIGLFFGLWPARRAALLDPIESLRYE